MTRRRYSLRDDQWERIRGMLPGSVEWVGATAKDNRLFVEAVLYRYRAGIPWRDLPERFGDFRDYFLEHFQADALLAHRAFDADERVIQKLQEQGKEAVIPSKSNRKQPREYDKELYKARHLIEISSPNSTSTEPLTLAMTSFRHNLPRSNFPCLCPRLA